MPLKLTDMPNESSNVSRLTLKAQIADKLSALIVSQMIKEGEPLPSERDLAKSYNVSRETIRGALSLLSQKGIIAISRGKKSTVAIGSEQIVQSNNILDSLQDYDVLTIVETRKVIESAILRSAAINISQEDLDKLSTLIEYQETVTDDHIAFQVSDREFHTIIYQACRNTLLSKIAIEVYSYALEHRTAVLSDEKSTVRSLREHHQILRSLKNHDPDAAERSILGHVDSIFKSTFIMQNTDNE
ncbi:FadR/GntR family transcriptional regulator [Vibrio caribbeanicus]|uniref:GntR domain-containing protein n=1 Tax=Vibrio caribbeanicus ATCC BAA-2122 TaxID=796620 RepID=E3BH17_9VIBR|nr:FCD domain-containing protein [Vibrio caribbeanicus]EFP97654.1 GntR domain-containing protein [Vibrio caribbeanicus ATCC BAA-2122]MCY9846346.1 FCD domain-containing protein [Vibrio caribbeanicus]